MDSARVASWRPYSPEQNRKKGRKIKRKNSRSAMSGSVMIVCLFVFVATASQWARASSFLRFLDHTRYTTFGRTPLDEWSARRRDLYLTTHNTHDIHAPGGIRTHNLRRRAVAMRGITLTLLRVVTQNFTGQKTVPARPSGKGWLETR